MRQAVNQATDAAGNADASALVALLGDDFSGNDNALSRDDLGNLLRVVRLRHESIHVLLGPVAIEPRGERYVARFTATLSSGGRLLPSDLGVYTVESAWRRHGRTWVCYSARWKRSL